MSEKVQFIRVPRAAMKQHQRDTWDEMVAAAEEKRDGLCVEGPSVKTWYAVPPRDEDALKKWERANDAAYFRQADKPFSHLANLYQQCWDGPA